MDASETKPKKKIQSSIPELTVGEERKLFNQIRKSAAYITPDTLLFNGWTAGGFALTYIIQHHMKRKRKAEEKTSEDGNKRPRTKAFEDPLTMTSLDDKEEEKPKPKRKVAPKRKAEVPSPPPLVRQTCDDVQLEFCEIKDISEANKIAKKEPKAKPKAAVPKKPRKKADPEPSA
tara:strand:- start:773 stop:1297 length:525 start_codon:yes stop_codon:yes gene_type:complete